MNTKYVNYILKVLWICAEQISNHSCLCINFLKAKTAIKYFAMLLILYSILTWYHEVSYIKIVEDSIFYEIQCADINLTYTINANSSTLS